MPPFAQHAPTGCDDNSSLFVQQHDHGKAGSKSIAASGVWDEVTYSSEGPSFFDRFFDLNLCCSLNDQVGNNNNKQVEEGNTTDNVVVEQNFTTDRQQYQSRVNREQKIEILKAIHRMKSPIKEAEEAVNHRRRREAAAEQYVYMKPSDDDTTLPTKNNESWQVFDTPFSIQHDGNNRKNEDTRAQILKNNNSRVKSTKRRSVTKERDMKRMNGPNQFKKVQSNRTPHDVSSHQNEKETNMMKRIKKSLSTKKKVTSNSGILVNDVSSSTRTTKRTNKSLSLKKFKSIHHKGETTSPPSSNKKRKSRMAKRKKLSSSKNQIDKETRQDVERAASSSLPGKRSSFTKRISKSFSTKNKDKGGTGNNSVDEVVVDWSQQQ